MKTRVYLFLFYYIVITGCSNKERKLPEKSIPDVMHEQAEEWNKGDIDGFMQGYQNHDSLPFIGKNGITYGYNTIADRYKKSYPDKDAMGQLSFNDINIKPLADDYAYVTARWTLYRTHDTLSGYTSLLFQNIENSWYIIADHSS